MNKATLKKNRIIIASVEDSLGTPRLTRADEYPDYTILFKRPLELRGIDKVELRVLHVDEKTKQINTCFHAVSKFNPQVSTARAILLSYLTMKNTTYQIIRQLF